MNRFEGQRCIITGGARGLGLAVARRLLREGASAVQLWDNSAEHLGTALSTLAAEGHTVTTATVDITDEPAVENGVGAFVTANGALEVMVNCAAIVGPNSKLSGEVTRDEFETVMRINITGSYLVAKHALRAMVPKRYGRVLLLASIAGKEGNPKMMPYSASKGAVMAMVKSMGKEYCTLGDITVNALAPCTFETPMVAAMDPDTVAYMKSKIPKGQFATIEKVAATVAYIVSPETSETTGFTYDHSNGRAVS